MPVKTLYAQIINFTHHPERAAMRIVSLITAVAVVSILYVLVFERDVLEGFSDGENIEETDRITVGIMPTEIEGPHGITIDAEGKHWYLSMLMEVQMAIW